MRHPVIDLFGKECMHDAVILAGELGLAAQEENGKYA